MTRDKYLNNNYFSRHVIDLVGEQRIRLNGLFFYYVENNMMNLTAKYTLRETSQDFVALSWSFPLECIMDAIAEFIEIHYDT